MLICLPSSFLNHSFCLKDTGPGDPTLQSVTSFSWMDSSAMGMVLTGSKAPSHPGAHGQHPVPYSGESGLECPWSQAHMPGILHHQACLLAVEVLDSWFICSGV